MADDIPGLNNGDYIREQVLRVRGASVISLGERFIRVQRQSDGSYQPIVAGGDDAAILADLAAIQGETDKIDGAATDGLAGISNSLAYRVHEIETHNHSYERFLEVASVPSGETHRADPLGAGAGAFQIDADNDDWGAWVQVLGSDDTPVQSGMVEFDFHRIEVEATERTNTYFIQVAFGDSGAAALAAGDYTETVVTPASNLIDSGPVMVQAERQSAGTKVWARCKCPGQDTGTFDFYPGLHEYPG